jgi:hypothetical protein
MTTPTTTNQKPRHTTSRQKVLAVAVAIVTVSYLVLVTTGRIKAENRLTGAELGMVVFSAAVIFAALRPDFVSRLQRFDVAGIKVELGEVKKDQLEVQKHQQEQAAVLADVQLALRLLIGKNEQQHLINLLNRTTSAYQMKGPVRDEIRHLRAMKLVTMRPDKTVGGMPDKMTFDLSDYIELTEEGRNYVSRLTEQSES